MKTVKSSNKIIMRKKSGTRKLRIVKSLNANEWFVGTAGFMTSQSKWQTSGKLNLMEVNSSFYKLPGQQQVRNLLKLPDNVSFVFKMSRYVTHIKRLKDSGDAIQLFMDSIKHIIHRTRGILIQLPPSFTYKDVNFERLKAIKTRFDNKKLDIFIEFRDPSWFREDVYKFMKKVQWVIVGTWIMKRTGTAFMGNMPGGLVIPGPSTTQASYVRIHGGRGFRGELSDKQLQELRDSLNERNTAHNYVVFNNTFFKDKKHTCMKYGVTYNYAAVCNAIDFSILVN